mmetsp:Transcript_22898/g.35844  ORF Transcript_22898/g.35844 Transcript_22898/m.35844 type:complete len:269 (+) Transcript_22898:81-887(+)|eukprot:CAMPEP_0201727764 /NCGR_PEP_ID=MMETSP0593-20130828/13503_1 /ASSEMBLY_ACC=CAM_ASM_000672 /TAXON_ID=267983 /ORGANISM="Skeletonema japonicum, Strain CCMP2506" /LENGTH=268 /DNA_ID=CAMNT_0048219679 /DNA_START=18 /DNA_END=824 /DNA_ORIENTATION=-
MISLPTLVTLACSVSSGFAFHTAPSAPYRPASLSRRAETFLPNSSSIAPKNSRNQSLLRIATTANGEKAPSDAMIRQIDQKISNYEKKQEKYLSKLESAKAELEKFKETKQRYLAGDSLGSSDTASFSETTARSLVKSMMWRVIAGSVTFFTSLRFSGNMSTALSIVGSDFFSKAATMFIGERLMNKSQAGRKGGADDVGRSLAKALLWRLFAIANTLTMSLLIAKDLSIASKIAGSDAIFKTGLMFVYERVWAKIEWGKEYLIEFSI